MKDLKPDTSPFQRMVGQPPLVYGHRGASARARDNTWEAFQLALNEGADGIELDIRTTSDAKLVVFHDAFIEMGEEKVFISRLSFAQLSAALPHELLTLDQVLDFRDQQAQARLNIELKGDVPNRSWLAGAVTRTLADRGTARILLSSFHPDLVWWCARLLPQVPVALLVDGASSLRLGARIFSGLGAVGVHPSANLITRSWVQRIRERGGLVNAWTVNDPSEARRLSHAGVDGMITDTPQDILERIS